MTLQDQTTLVLTAWRENRGGGGVPGMQSVINVICNRAARDSISVTAECLKRLQFSSMTAPGDPELHLGPDPLVPTDWASWEQAVMLVVMDPLADITGGATDYYAPGGLTATQPYTLPDGTATVAPAKWNMATLQFTVQIAGQLFFK